jgi:hypothetical protein
MDRISRLVVWICSKFDREQIVRIVTELNEVLQNRNPEILPKDDLKKTSQLPQLPRRSHSATHHRSQTPRTIRIKLGRVARHI